MSANPQAATRRPVWHGLMLAALGITIGFALAAIGLPWWVALPTAIVVGEAAIRLVDRVSRKRT